MISTNIRDVMLYAVLLLAYLYTCNTAQAMIAADSCGYEIKGRIVDVDTGQPVPYVSIKLKNTKQWIVANEYGEFVFNNLCQLEYTLICSSIGYKTVTHHHDSHHDQPVIYMASMASELESVVVEGRAITGDMESMSLTKIGHAELTTRSTQSLAAAIRNIQGVSLASTGSNIQLPVIHGLYGNRILIINNGVKHGFQNWGTDHAPEVDIVNANNITILKGAAGVKYGPEALGGAIIVEGHPLGLEEKLHGHMASGYETNGRGYYTNAYIGKGYKKFSYHLGGNFRKIGDREAPDYSLTNTGMEEMSANVGVRYHLPNWDFDIRYSYINQHLGLLRSSVAESGDLFARSLSSDRPLIIEDFSYDINEPRQNTTHHQAISSVDWHSPIGKFSLLISHQTNLRKEFDVRRNADLPIIDLGLGTNDLRLEWVHPSVSGFEGTIGFQYFNQNNDNNPGTGTTPFIPNYNTQRFSAFMIESITKGQNTFELGLRVDHEYNSVRGRETNQDLFRNEFTFSNITASLGLIRELSSTWQLRMNLGSAWRTPNMAELYSFGQQGFKTQFGLWRYYRNENGELRTDRVLTEEDGAAQAEKGYKWINELAYKKDNHELTITAYSHVIDNYIFERPVAVIGTIRGPMPVFIYDQADAAFTGVDFTYTRKINKTLKSTLGASYLWSQNIRKNEPLINQPPVNINADLSWQTPQFLGLSTSKISLRTSYTFRQFQAPRTVTAEQLINREVLISADSEIFDFRDAPEGYFLGNLLWEWKKGSLGGQVEVRNMFNTSYRDYLNQMRYFADEVGRNFILSINYNF